MTAAASTPDDVGGRLLPLDRRNAAQQIADRVVTAIALGEFVEGQRLPAERELARMLGTARPTIREALQRLESQGFVAIHRGRNGGAFVQPFDSAAARDSVRQTLLPTWAEFEVLFDFRTLIEGLVAATAATRRTPGDVSAIESALDAYRGASDSRESSRSADEALHRAIATATHNRYLLELSAELRAKVSLGFLAEPYSPVLRRRALEQHPALVAAIVDGDAERAARLAGEHFGLTEKMFRRVRASVDGDTAARR